MRGDQESKQAPDPPITIKASQRAREGGGKVTLVPRRNAKGARSFGCRARGQSAARGWPAFAFSPTGIAKSHRGVEIWNRLDLGGTLSAVVVGRGGRASRLTQRRGRKEECEIFDLPGSATATPSFVIILCFQTPPPPHTPPPSCQKKIPATVDSLG
jgi:hypothetical protein